MKKVYISGHALEIYDDIEDMPVSRFHKFNRFLLVDSGIGGSVEAFDLILARAVRFMKAGDNDSAAKELENMRQGIHAVCSGVSPEHLAFASLVKSIDGKDVDDISEEGLSDILKQLPGMTVRELSSHMREVKKKTEGQLRTFFPGMFDDTEDKAYFAKLRKLAMAMADEIERGERAEDSESGKMANELLSMRKPKPFYGPGGAEVEFDRQYETSCLVISSELHMDAKEMTVSEYYHAVAFLKDKAKAAETARISRGT